MTKIVSAFELSHHRKHSTPLEGNSQVPDPTKQLLSSQISQLWNDPSTTYLVVVIPMYFKLWECWPIATKAQPRRTSQWYYSALLISEMPPFSVYYSRSCSLNQNCAFAQTVLMQMAKTCDLFMAMQYLVMTTCSAWHGPSTLQLYSALKQNLLQQLLRLDMLIGSKGYSLNSLWIFTTKLETTRSQTSSPKVFED